MQKEMAGFFCWEPDGEKGESGYGFDQVNLHGLDCTFMKTPQGFARRITLSSRHKILQLFHHLR
jgi:hypothetical protein